MIIAHLSVVIEQIVVLPVAESIEDLGKSGSLHGSLMPALKHKRVRSLRTFVGYKQQLAIADHFNSLWISAARIRLTSVVENLPQTHAVRPNVGLFTYAVVVQ